MNTRLLSLVSLFCLLLFSCADNPRKSYEKAVLEWTGKTILIPDSMHSVLGECVPTPDTEYTIVAYFDSVGCTG